MVPITRLGRLGLLEFEIEIALHCNPLQGSTGKYRENPAMTTGFPCNESRFSPMGIDLQGKAVSCTGFGFTVHVTLGYSDRFWSEYLKLALMCS